MGPRTRALSAACTFVAAAGCAHAPPRAGLPPLTVDVVRAELQDIGNYVTLDGQIVPKQQSQLALQQSGTVVRVDVVQGQHVSAGQELAKLDDSTLRADLANAQAQVTASKASLDKTTLLTNANDEQYGQTVSQDKAAVSNAVAQLANAKLVFTQNQTLFKQGYVSQTALEQARANDVAAEQTLQGSRDKLRQDTAALSNIPAYRQTIENTRATLDQARAQAQLYRTAIAQTTLFAPYDGVVTQRLLDPGAYAAPNQPILTISQVDPVYVDVNVPDDDLAFVRAGTRVTFKTSTDPNRTYAATIGSVNAVPSQGTLSYQAQIVMPNKDFSLRGGQLVAVTARQAYHAHAVVVPRSALFFGAGGTSLFTVVAGRALAVPVGVGIQTDLVAEVHSPRVVPGTPVITTRPDALQSGSPVVVANQPPPGPTGSMGGQAGTSTK